MKTNMGGADRAVRVVLAIVFAALWYTGTVSGALGTVLLVLAVVFLGTSAIGFCPLYMPLGINTCGKKGTAG